MYLLFFGWKFENLIIMRNGVKLWVILKKAGFPEIDDFDRFDLNNMIPSRFICMHACTCVYDAYILFVLNIV